MRKLLPLFLFISLFALSSPAVSYAYDNVTIGTIDYPEFNTSTNSYEEQLYIDISPEQSYPGGTACYISTSTDHEDIFDGGFLAGDKCGFYTNYLGHLQSGFYEDTPFYLLISDDNPTDPSFEAFSQSNSFMLDFTPITPNNAPEITLGDAIVADNEPYLAGGSFTDSDSVQWEATVDYDDGSGVQPLALVGSNGKQFEMDHEYTSVGEYDVKVTITDDSDNIATKTASISVQHLTYTDVTVENIEYPEFDFPSNTYNGQTYVEVAPVQTYSTGTTCYISTSAEPEDIFDGGFLTPDGKCGFYANYPNHDSSGYYNDTPFYVLIAKGAPTDLPHFALFSTSEAFEFSFEPPANPAPQVSELPDTTLSDGQYSQSGSFSDYASSSWTATVDYGDGSGVQDLDLNGSEFTLNHSYATGGEFTVTVNVTDNQEATGTRSATVIVDAVSQVELTSLDPARVWIGVANSDDAGIKFDLKAEVYKGNTLISSGQLNSVFGGSTHFNGAKHHVIPFSSFEPVVFRPGTNLRFKLYVRNACTGSGQTSGVARLWFDNSAANSRFKAFINDDEVPYFLRENNTLATEAGVGPKNYVDQSAGAQCSVFKSIGTWTVTL